MELLDKLTILADAAKYDAACTSSGLDRAGRPGQLGSTTPAGCCHSFSADGRCVTLLKVLMTNVCAYDCQYCVNRRSNDVPRAAFTPRELAELTIQFYRRNYIEGLFLSSAVSGNPDCTTERMMEAPDRLEFETAALIRDQINAITKVTAGQKVVVDPDVEMDVVALAGTPGSVCAAVLRFREGRLTDKREFLFHDTADIAAAREEFLPRYYLDDEQIPKVIAVDELPPDADALQQALNEKRGSEVQLYVPQRGDKARLVEMAHTNAVERLARESGRYAREEKLLDELAQVLGLAKPPRAIESYDISNWGDGTSVCGMVTFKDGKPYKAGYRKFKMKTVLGTDDYASLAETVSRRAAEYEKYAALAKAGEPSNNYFGQKPDLLLMDGGRGQVSAAREALAGTALADVPLYGMVKDDHHRTRAIVDSEGREIAINMNRGTFTFITAIQDETHRFANAYRKQQMHQKSYASTLTEVPGVGPKTAKALMARFKSVSAVREAAIDQLENTPGVGPRLARTIYDHFHPQN